MRLKMISARAHPAGNRIDLAWEYPEPIQFPGVRVIRREGSYPTSPEDGVQIAQGVNLRSTIDKENLKGQTVYYYTLFLYETNPANVHFDAHNRVAAMATSPYDLAGQMYDLVPRIYHRYDTGLLKTTPVEMSEADKHRGQLRRFLELPGSQLDQLYSFARAILDLYNLDRVDGRLLPLLAQWIGWQTDYRLEIAAQRNEIRNAPFVYETIGIIPTVESTVKRITGWESRTKEFVHNVLLSNRPERLNIWARERRGATWSQPTEPLSLNFAYEGRPTATRDQDGMLWLFYHALKKGQWDIWYKTLSIFSIALVFKSDLDNGAVSLGLQQAFQANKLTLSQHATITKQVDSWSIADVEQSEVYVVREEAGQLNVYRWAPSRPLTNRRGLDRHPTAVVQGNTLWVFWDVYDETGRRWRIDFRTRTGDVWSAIQTFADAGVERKQPATLADDTGVWLFWLERVGGEWQLKYNRHNGTDWQLSAAASFPPDAGGADPKVQDDVFVLFHPTNAIQQIWVFWARYDPISDPKQTRWTVAYRVKQGVDPANTSDWSAVRTLPKATPDDYHDREPMAIVDAGGQIELFWSSNRVVSWSIWRNSLNIATPHTWGTAEQITNDPYAQRAPVAIGTSQAMLLIYRSNQSVAYTSKVYGATDTSDFRYAGCTTVDTRNGAKIALRGTFEDFQTYTYDAGTKGERTNQDWYARDTIGLYLTPDTADAEQIAAGKSRLERILGEFMPVTDRAVLI